MVIISINRYLINNHCAIEKQRDYLWDFKLFWYNCEGSCTPSQSFFKLKFGSGSSLNNKIKIFFILKEYVTSFKFYDIFD